MDAVLHALLGNALFAAALAVPAVAAGWLGARPALAHSLWLLVLLKLLTPPLARVPLPWPPPAAPPPENAPIEAEIDAFCPADLDAPAVPAPPASVPEAVPADEVPAGAAPQAEAEWPWRPALLGLWLAGAGCWWALAGVRLRRLGRVLRAVPPAPDGVQARARALAARLGLRRCPGVWLVPGPVSPMLLALGLTPRLLLPAALWDRLSPAQRDTLLLHELAHLRRRDHWVRRLELLALGLYWWYPLAWWARRRLQEAEEQCCDAWVVWAAPEAAPDYAGALLETLAFLSGVRPALPAGASGAGPVPLLKRRLIMILRDGAPRSLSRPALAGVLALAVLVLPLVPGGARTAPDPDKAAPAAADKSDGGKRAAAHKSCLACHAWVAPAWAKPSADWHAAHAKVVALMDDLKSERATAKDREAALQAKLEKALAQLEALQGREKKGEKAPKKADGDAPEKRLREMEKKLDALLKEVEGLRREMRGKKPAAVAGRRDGAYFSHRDVKLPIRIPRDAAVEEVLAHVSTDGGKTYELAARMQPGTDGFPFNFTQDGAHGFVFQVRDKGGSLRPEKVEGRVPTQTVIVDTVPPKVKLTTRPQPGGVAVLWEVSDAHLDPDTLVLEQRAAGESGWRALPAAKAARGLTPCGPGEVRLRVRDLAGNEGSATLTVPAPAPK